MKIIHFAIALSMVSALSLGISGIVMAAEPDSTYTTDEIKAGQGYNIYTYDLPAKGGTGIYAYENNGNQPYNPPLKPTGTRDKRVVVVLAQLPASGTAPGFLGGYRHDA